MYFMQKGITIFRWKIFVSQFEKFRRGNRLCLRKFRVSKNFMPKKGISRVSIKNIVVSQYRKYFVGEPFFVSETFWYRKKLMDKRGGGREEGVSRFSVEDFWSHSAKIFRGHRFKISENLGYRKILCIIVSQFSVENILSHGAEKFRRGNLQCVFH